MSNFILFLKKILFILEVFFITGYSFLLSMNQLFQIKEPKTYNKVPKTKAKSREKALES